MVFSNGLAPNLYGLFIERFGLGVVAHRFVKCRQVVQVNSKIQMLFSKILQRQITGMGSKLDCFFISALLIKLYELLIKF